MTKPDPNVGAAAAPDRIPGVRPRIKKAESGLYECSDGVVSRAAKTKEGAYQRWLTAALKDMQTKLGASWPAPAPAAPQKRKRTVRGKAPDPIMPPARLQPPRPPAPPAYTGPVTVIAGTVSRPALQLPTSLRLNGARAAAAQPRMMSMGAGNPREEAA